MSSSVSGGLSSGGAFLTSPITNALVVEEPPFNTFEDFEDDIFIYPIDFTGSTPNATILVHGDAPATSTTSPALVSRGPIARSENFTLETVRIQANIILDGPYRVMRQAFWMRAYAPPPYSYQTGEFRNQGRLVFYDAADNEISNQVVCVYDPRTFVAVQGCRDDTFQPVDGVYKISVIHETVGPVQASIYDMGLEDFGFRLQRSCAPFDSTMSVPDCPQITDDDLVTFNLSGSVHAMNKNEPDSLWYDSHPGEPDEELSPASTSVLSPDGQYVAFIRDGVVHLMSYGGHNIRQLYQEDSTGNVIPIEASQPVLSWSSDSNRIAFINSVNQVDYIDLETMEVIDEKITYDVAPLTSVADATSIAYSDQTSNFVTIGAATDGGSHQIYYNGESGPRDLFVGEADNIQPTSLAFGLDGIVFVRQFMSENRLYSWDPLSSGLPILLDRKVDDKGVALSPFGDYVMYVRTGGSIVVLNTSVAPYQIATLRTDSAIGEEFPSWRHLPLGSDCSSNQVHVERLYPGISQEMRDMLAFADETGLIVHSAPIVNAIRGTTPDPSVRNDAGISQTHIPWGDPTNFVVDSRAEFKLDGSTEVGQVWYQVRGIGWILGYHQDFTTEGVWQQYGFIVNGKSNCEHLTLSPTDGITFHYDRQMAARFAIAHSYQNEVDLPPPLAVVQRLDSDNLASHSNNPMINLDEIPYAFYWFSTLDNHLGPRTGSAAFISEALWFGGYPFTFDKDQSTGCGDAIVESESGWRYCAILPSELYPDNPSTGDGNRVWYGHLWLTPYYTAHLLPRVDNPTEIDTEDGPDDVITTIKAGDKGNAVPIPPTGNIAGPSIWLERLEKLPNFSIEQGLFYDDPLTASDEAEVAKNAISNLARDSLSFTGTGNDDEVVERGDYVWINTGSGTPGDPLDDRTHGFLVVGWYTADDCSAIIHPDTGTRPGLSEIADTYETAISTITNPVPYVVDFSYQIQQPIPRPFYCSHFDAANTYDQTDVGGGLPWHWDFFNRHHNWYFFHMPDDVTLELQQIYVDLDWTWRETDGKVN